MQFSLTWEKNEQKFPKKSQIMFQSKLFTVKTLQKNVTWLEQGELQIFKLDRANIAFSEFNILTVSKLKKNPNWKLFIVHARHIICYQVYTL